MAERNGSPGLSWPAGYDLQVLEQVGSTNAEALRIAAALERPRWILALRQTGGHGRRGRAWTDLPGNLSATLVMRPEDPPQRMALRSFVAALALRDALAACIGRAEGIALKWPNDVLLQGGKIAGILLEGSGGALAIGFGVNLASAPPAGDVEPGAVAPVSLAGATGLAVAPAEFLDLLAPSYAAREAQFRRDGFAPIRAGWLAAAARIGQPITARVGKAEHRGRFETVDEEGRLILQGAQGRQAIAAAEVYF